MELRIFTEPQQGATYDQLLRVAKAAEACGYGAFFRSDHYLVMTDEELPHDAVGLPGPTDAWITLAGLARETTTIRLGTLVTAATFRLPGPLAISVAQVDQMSSGRVELGLGTGWFEAEHTAYGIPFPPVRERFDRLAEQLDIITGLWSTPVGSTFDFTGAHYQLANSPGLPKPLQQPIPVIIGGNGAVRTPALAAKFAAEYNVPFDSVANTAAAFDRVRAAARTTGRDPATITYSAAQILCCGRTDAEIARRAAAIGRDADEMREHGLAGMPAEIVEKAAQFAEVGATRLYLQVLDLADLDHLELVAAEVMPKL